MNPRVLVTGCTGLVGHGICFFLLNKGYEVWGTSRKPLRTLHNSFHPVQMDLSNLESIRSMHSVFNMVDAVIHNAASIPVGGEETWGKRDKYVTNNIIGTYELLKLADIVGTRRFIFISSICS